MLFRSVYAQQSNGSGVDNLWTAKTRDTIKSTTPIPYIMVTTHSAEDAYERVLEYAGASLKRDEHDELMVSDTRNNVATYGNSNNLGGYIDNPYQNKPVGAPADWSPWPTLVQDGTIIDTDGDGIPDSWELANDMDPNDPSDAKELNRAGYTMLEVYLNSLVNKITNAQNVGGTMMGFEPEDLKEDVQFVNISDQWISSNDAIKIGRAHV